MRSNLFKYVIVACIGLIWMTWTGAVLGGLLA
jgi:hypothetical protein